MITTEVKTHVIVYHDKSTTWVTEKEAQYIFTVSAQTQSKGIKLKDGSWVSFGSIAKILTQQEYYDQYPKQRPVEVNDYKKNDYLEIAQHRNPTTRQRELMKQGFIQQQMGIGRTREVAEQRFEDFIRNI